MWLALGGTLAFVVLLAVLVGSPAARGSRAAKVALVIVGLVTLAILVPFVAILAMLVGGFGP